ncbi:MAG: glutamate synthase subunit beta [Clostridia bacterium]|nr:glutamate synthase subunit beta [Clostridia bacterium]
MGKATGFMEYPREENPYREAHARLGDFDELHTLQPADMRRWQAGRCMDCGVPFCQSDFGCPLHNLIPEWNDLLYKGQERAALERLLMTAPFPEFTGRVCPALCEKACNLADDGVTNRDNELYLVENGFAKGWMHSRIPPVRTAKQVAVIGSGPAGLAAADWLNQAGHRVTVIERADRPGGLLMYGIPNMKLPKSVIARRVRLMETEGISFVLGTAADPDQLRDYDAVLFCCGSRKPRSLHVAHLDADGVAYAVNYLTASTRSLLSGEVPELSARGKHVIVVGGGDTGNDCVGTALRQGCIHILQLEMLEKAPMTRTDANPWPQWPRILRTDYGQAEAIHVQGSDPRVYETTVKSIEVNADNRIAALETVRLRKCADGKRLPVAGSEQTMRCDLLLIAAGFTGCEEETLARFALSADDRGRLMPGDASHYLGGKYFSAGDARTGQSLVVRALADGRAAAREVDAWLRKAG